MAERITEQAAEQAAQVIADHYSTSYGWCAAHLKQGTTVRWSHCQEWKGAKAIRDQWMEQGLAP